VWAEAGYAGIVRTLLQAGADVKAVNGQGDMALTMAQAKCHDEIVRILEQAGAAR